MNRASEAYRRNLIIAAAIRMAMFLPDRPVLWSWERINGLPKMDGRLTKDPAERN